jgi:hypothetical protein
MLILCYGITKSGSTLAFELVKGMLASAGHVQERLPNGVVEPTPRINFISGIITRERLRALIDTIGRDRIIAVKTHTEFDTADFRWIEEAQLEGALQVIASYRDPRDICLSLCDAGERSRARNIKAFSKIDSLARAIKGVQRQFVRFRKWAALQGTLRLDYACVAFNPDEAMERIARKLGIAYDAAAARKHAFEDAITQKNKAIPRRHEAELDEEQQVALTRIFSEELKGAFELRDESWFQEYREALLHPSESGRKRQNRLKRKLRRRERRKKNRRP